MLQAVFALMLCVLPQAPADKLPDPYELLVADRRIDIPRLPANTVAYNPSMVEYRGTTYMAFRLDRQDLGWATQMQLGIVQLDSAFKVVRGPTLLDTRDVPWANHTSEDPRLIVHENQMYIVFNATHDGSMNSRRAIRLARLRVPSVLDPEDDFEVVAVSELIANEQGFRPWQEKNWSPFSYDGLLHFIYRSNPPKMYRIEAGDLRAMPKEIYVNKTSELTHAVPYAWGEMRGGTQAKYDPSIDKFVSFFHTQNKKDFGSGYKIHYFIGFYAFDPEPPFAISHVLPDPIIVPRMHNAHRPYIQIAYPGGFIDKEDVVHVCYGKNDSSIRILTLDKARLIDGLQNVQQPQKQQNGQVDQ